MKTKKVQALNGAVEFEFLPPTLAGEAEAARRLDEIGEVGEMVWQQNIAFFVAQTVGVYAENVYGDLAALIEFWEMTQNGTPTNEWVEWFGKNVHRGIYNAWFEAQRARHVMDLPGVADPNSKTPQSGDKGNASTGMK